MEQKCEEIIKKMHDSYKMTGNKDEVGQLCQKAYADYKAGRLSQECYNSIYYHAVTIGTNR
ncbi:hypothetical protein [Bacillus timonensis]|uniref:hypothetical protein n=1 Tax=Bacillus timonensis TaxID=1033734 RepID=UPI000289C07B|nr:hypothetical protein [Bacillus timonensis]